MYDDVVVIAQLLEQIDTLETQWRQQSSRLAPPPRLVKSVSKLLAGPQGAVAALRARGERLVRLMGDGRFFRHDVDEWYRVKVEDALARASRLIDQANSST